MTQINFTLDFDKLKEEIGKSDLNDIVKSSIVLVLNQYMEMERDRYIQANSHERSSERTDYRNGYYEREMIVNVGKIRLKVPRTRNGEFATDVFEKYARCDKALLLSMLEMVVNGVSTRKVTKIMEELCGESISKSMVSNLTKKLDPLVNDWANRPLNVMYFPYLFVDAMYIKVREHNKVVSKAVYIAMGVNEQNKREIIGLKVDHSESETNWREFFESLKSRGLQSPKLIISDAHQGLKAAITKAFIGTSWQRCTVHMLRNMIQTMPRKDSKEARSQLKAIFKSSNLEEAKKLKDEFMATYEEQKGYQKAILILDEGFDDATQFYTESEDFHIHLRTTNVLERLNSEIRRREQVIRVFPNHQSAFRLIGAVLMDYADTLDLGNRKFLHPQ
ncbi:IS256 family transposase [Heyndrickxia acidicola]|nr:IS256 family transposase [Heyndrickxia acidicola]